VIAFACDRRRRVVADRDARMPTAEVAAKYRGGAS
jgi:hypothetical protein